MRVFRISLQIRRLQFLKGRDLRHIDDVKQANLRARKRYSRIVIYAEVAHGMGNYWNSGTQQHGKKTEESNSPQEEDPSPGRLRHRLINAAPRHCDRFREYSWEGSSRLHCTKLRAWKLLDQGRTDTTPWYLNLNSFY